MLTVKVQELDGDVIVQCAGRMVRGEETALLCEASRWHHREVVLDLGEVDSIDAAGIGLLISLQASGIYLKLTNPSKPVREMLQLTHVESVFEICDTPAVVC